MILVRGKRSGGGGCRGAKQQIKREERKRKMGKVFRSSTYVKWKKARAGVNKEVFCEKLLRKGREAGQQELIRRVNDSKIWCWPRHP